jgi:hypothetical protein
MKKGNNTRHTYKCIDLDQGSNDEKKKAKMVSILSWTGKPSLHGVACCRSRGGCATREASPSVFHRKFSAAPHTHVD